MAAQDDINVLNASQVAIENGEPVNAVGLIQNVIDSLQYNLNSGGTNYFYVPPVVPPVDPPPTGLVMVGLGDATYDGQPLTTSGFGKGDLGLVAFDVPSNASLGVNQITVYEAAGGTSTYEGWWSQTPWDLTATGAYHQKSNGLTFNYTTDPSKVDQWTILLRPGQTWYLMLTSPADIKIKWYPTY